MTAVLREDDLSEVHAAISLQSLGSQSGRHRNIACGVDCWASLFGGSKQFASSRRPLWQLIGHLSASKYLGKVVVMSGSDPRYIQMSATIARTRGLTVAATLAKPFRKREVTELLTRLAVSTD